MTEKYIVVSDDEYCYTLDTQAENYRSLEDFEKKEFQNAKKENVDIKEYEDAILQSASDKYWEWVYDNHIEPDTVNDIMNALVDENEQLKEDLDYFKSKNGSLETGMFNLERENKRLKNLVEALKRVNEIENRSGHEFIKAYSKTNGELLNKIEHLKSSINEICTEITEKNMTKTEIQVKLMNILDKVD